MSEREVRYLALQIGVQLPLGDDDAERVLRATRELRQTFLNTDGNRNLPPRCKLRPVG